MADEWIKMRKCLPGEPEVRLVAKRLSIDVDTVVGKLLRLWSLADTHAINGRLDGYTSSDIDEEVRQHGFAAALAEEKWLIIEENSVTIPNFDRHNGRSSKIRAQDADRQRRRRQGNATAESQPGGPLWDALCAAFNLRPATPRELERLQRVVRDLNAKSAKPDEIARQLERYRKKFPNAADTPEAVVKHWDQLKPAPTNKTTSTFRQYTRQQLIDSVRASSDVSELNFWRSQFTAQDAESPEVIAAVEAWRAKRQPATQTQDGQA
jgi:hypothetical protein